MFVKYFQYHVFIDDNVLLPKEETISKTFSFSICRLHWKESNHVTFLEDVYKSIKTMCQYKERTSI